jgi:hypothetical protein
MSGVRECVGKRIPCTVTYLLKCPESSLPSLGVWSDDVRLGRHRLTNENRKGVLMDRNGRGDDFAINVTRDDNERDNHPNAEAEGDRNG